MKGNKKQKVELTKRQQKWLKNWEYWHKKGKWRYMLSTGITWGIFTGLFITLFYHWYYKVCEPTGSVIIRLIFFVVLGVPYAYILWRVNEKKYKKIKGE